MTCALLHSIANALNMGFEKATCTKHIHRAYYQHQLWVEAPFRDATTILDAESYTVNQKVCSSRESLVTIFTPKYGVMRTPHRLGVKYTPNLA